MKKFVIEFKDLAKTVQAVKSSEGKIRYWLPVKDCDDVYVHITLNPNIVN